MFVNGTTFYYCSKCQHSWIEKHQHVCPPTFEEQQAAIRKLALSQATIEELLAELEARGCLTATDSLEDPTKSCNSQTK